MDMPFDPEGPQGFGDLTGEARMIPLVEPPELEAIFAKARARVDAAGLIADYVWAAGNVSEKISSAARDRDARLVVLGAHHHGFFGRLIGTDVAAQVGRELDDAGTDVVVVD
jgi:nucleotide-binding universal stress UspA family protein